MVLKTDALINILGQLLLQHPNKAVRVLCRALFMNLKSDDISARTIPLQHLAFSIITGLGLSLKYDNPIQLRQLYSKIIDGLIQLLQNQRETVLSMSPEELEQWFKDLNRGFEMIVSEKSLSSFALSELAKRASWQIQDPAAVCLAYALQAAICRHSLIKEEDNKSTNIASCLTDALSVFTKEENPKKALSEMLEEVHKSIGQLRDAINKAKDKDVNEAIDTANLMLEQFPRQALWREEDGRE